MTSSEPDQRFLNEMHKLVVTHYDKEELKTLCFNLNIDYDNLDGEGKSAKARELVLKLRRLERINDLKNKVMEDYPQISYSGSLHPHSNENPLSMKVISSHAGPDAWNQGEPLSPFQFVIKLDLVNQSPKPIILKSIKISAFDVPHERLNQNLPLGTLLFIENNNKIPINIFPYQISGKYFGLIEYQIKIQLDDQKRLKFIPDSDVFQSYSIKLSYEYYGMDRVAYNDSILIQGTFQEFKKDWLEVWNEYQHILLRRGLIDSIGGDLKL